MDVPAHSTLDVSALSKPRLASADWRRLNRLLAQALELEPDRRPAWIGALPNEDRDLAPVLAELLARADTSEGDRRLTHPAAGSLHRSAAAATEPYAEEQPGDQIGPYRLVRELGVGGMGTVWQAERTDGTFKRQVALKLPRAEWTDRGLSERMARERAVLASLNHPNIAQMYDAGWAGDGRPYLALEYVDGEPIDAWCRNRATPPAERVRLFVDVVRAVAFAHAKLVIHRDLKPGNVLVTGECRVKLLDFGIAKLLLADTSLAEETALTRLSGRALTLNYAAPEQILGRPISTAADTYSLGVMLFELLTGERPYRLARDSRGALEEAIVGFDPRLPSNVAADKTVARALRGDLDAIILKALAKEPEQRYETAAAFADDLERWLAQRPVRAQRSSGWYRARRFLVRHRFRVLAGTAAATALLVGIGALLWQRHIAGEEAARASSVRNFVLAIIAQADPSASRETRDADLALLTTAESRLASEMGMHPELTLELRIALAKAYRNRGEFVRAGETLRVAIADARRLMPASDPRLAGAWIEAAEWQVYPDEEIGAEVDRAIETMRQQGRDGAELAIEGLQQRAVRRVFTRGTRTEAVADFREALEIAVRYFGKSDRRTLRATVRLVRSQDEMPLAERLELTGNAYQSALTYIDRSDPIFLEVQAIHGASLCRAGQGREGLELIRSAVDAGRQRHGAGIVTERLLEILWWNLVLTGDVAAGLETAHEAYALAATREPAGRSNRGIRAITVLYSALFARRIEGIGPVLADLELASEATRDLQQAAMVWLLVQQGQTAGASQLAPHAIETANRARAPDFVSTARLGWSYALREDGKPEEAERVLPPAGQDLKPTNPVDGDDVLKEHAAVQLALGNAAQALTLADESIRRASTVKLQTDPYLSDLHLIRGQALLKLARAAEARDAFRISDDFWRTYDPASHWAAEARYWLARAQIEGGDAAGRPMLKSARAQLAKSPMPAHRALAGSGT